MKRKIDKIILLVIIVFFPLLANANNPSETIEKEEARKEENFEVKTFILDHLADAYEWHITSIGEKHISLPLPVILYSEEKGFSIFLSSHFHHGHKAYNGYYIAHKGDHRGKIVYTNKIGEVVRPWDFSMTKNALALIIGSIVLVFIIMYTAKSYKKNPLESKGGFIGFMEMFVMNINNDVIKPAIGEDYRRFSPYLLTVFFFIFVTNVLGLIPLFPGGANVTGNITITFALAIITLIIVNVVGTKDYYKEIFWPDVPVWLKIPIPIIPAIELIGVFTKPFALMIRLFANILAGHSIVLGLTCLVFITVKLGTGMNATMSVLSVLFNVFIGLVEILVAFIQAYVFTLLSAVFIGLARERHEH